MGNDNLRNALSQAGISGDELADLIKVDPRTVRRWLTGQPPYPRHRAKIARALDLTEQDLWPEIATPSPAADAHALASETILAFPHVDDAGAPNIVMLISSATERIELLDESLHKLLTQPGVSDLLTSKASQGCSVRILVETPGPSLTPLLNQNGIEIQTVEAFGPVAIHRADQQMLVTLQLDRGPDQPPVLLHLTQQRPGGVFDRLAEHYEKLWGTAIEPIRTERDIDKYLFEDDGDEDLPEEDRELDEPDQPVAVPEPQAQPAIQTSTQQPRRWPRRPPPVG